MGLLPAGLREENAALCCRKTPHRSAPAAAAAAAADGSATAVAVDARGVEDKSKGAAKVQGPLREGPPVRAPSQRRNAEGLLDRHPAAAAAVGAAAAAAAAAVGAAAAAAVGAAAAAAVVYAA